MAFLRTILRRLFYAAAACSTLLLVATLILWPISYFRVIEGGHSDEENDSFLTFDIASGRAKVLDICNGNAPEVPPSPPSWYFATYRADIGHWSYLTWNTQDPDSAFEPAPTFLGVCFHYYPPEPGSAYNFAFIPLSYFTVLFSILPLLAFRSLRRRRRLALTGRCPKCNYDLRAHSFGSACPECGTPVPKTSRRAGINPS